MPVGARRESGPGGRGSPPATFTAVPVSVEGSVVRLASATPLFQALLVGSSNVGTLARNQYDVTSDGQRFLVNVPAADPSTMPITVVVNWLKALA